MLMNKIIKSESLNQMKQITKNHLPLIVYLDKNLNNKQCTPKQPIILLKMYLKGIMGQFLPTDRQAVEKRIQWLVKSKINNYKESFQDHLDTSSNLLARLKKKNS